MSDAPQKLMRRWFQVGVREWFLMVALLVVGLGWWRDHSRAVRLEPEVQRLTKTATLVNKLANELGRSESRLLAFRQLVAEQRRLPGPTFRVPAEEVTITRRCEELRDLLRAIHNDTSRTFREKTELETQFIEELAAFEQKWLGMILAQ